MTITVVAQPDNPVAGADAYTTAQATLLTVPAPGLLTNDYDEDGDGLTVAPSLVVAPVNGIAVLLADGSFGYTPNPLFIGTDTFTYRIDDGTGRTADGTVTITVGSVVGLATLYLQPTGPSANVWDLSTTAPAAAAPVPDYDSDGDPGLTIKSSGGNENENDPAKDQIWSYAVPAPVQINGPVRLQLWSTSKDFKTDKSAHPHVYLYDCAAGGTGCVLIARDGRPRQGLERHHGGLGLPRDHDRVREPLARCGPRAARPPPHPARRHLGGDDGCLSERPRDHDRLTSRSSSTGWDSSRTKP